MAYSSYYTHAEAPAETPTGLRARVVNAHLAARWGYEAERPLPFGAAVRFLMPSRAAVVDRTHRHLPATRRGRLLDVGSGNGAFVERMRMLGWDAEGVEPDPRAVSVARESGLPVREGTVEGLAAGLEQSYDVITLDHVIEHLHDPAAALDSVHAALRPGGLLWIATPNLESLGHRRFGRDWLHLDPPRHLVLFNTSSLQALLRRSGFEPLAPPRPAPTAALTFPRSAAIRDGRLPGDGALGGGFALTAQAVLADQRAARRPRLAEELVQPARPAGAP
jgi:SAM-dependent methyltransferase